MKFIRPNCRVQFSADDIEFILSVLDQKIDSRECLIKLLASEEERDLILDDEALLKALLERRGCLNVSNHFYFYILVRHVFLRAEFKDRRVADYVAELLAEFSRPESSDCVLPGQPAPLNYFVDLMASLQTADDRSRFFLQVHMGNQSLFLSGVFPDRIRFRAETKGFPDLSYFERLGRASFGRASEHRLARRYEVDSVLNTLSERFDATRRALNDISDRFLFLGDSMQNLERLLLGNFQGMSPDAGTGKLDI